MWSVKKLSIWLFIVGMLVYIPSWFNGFVWDDEEQIVNNPFVKSFQYVGFIFSGSTFGGGGTSLPTGGYYKPLMSLWYMFNDAVWGNWAGGFHLTQSALHAVNSMLVFLLLVKLTRRKWLSYAAAMAWLVHPGNVESVAYTASAQEVLSTIFGLMALLVVVARKRLGLEEISALFLANCVWLFSLLSKESGAVFFVVITAYLLLVEKSWRLAKFYWLLWIPMMVVYAMLRFGIAKVFLYPHPVIPVAQLPFEQRMLTMIETLWQHIRIVFVPWQLYIGHHQVVTGWSMGLGVKFLVILVVLLAMITVTIKQKNRVGWFFLVWLVAAVGLTSNIFPLDMTYAERWSYTPILAFGGWFISIISLKQKNLAVYLATLLMAVFTGRTIWRQLDWHDGLRLYGRDLRYAQNAFDLENNYGVELMRAGRMGEAKGHFEKSVQLAPTWWTNYSNLGVVYQREGNEGKAMELYQKAIENGHYHLAYENLATLLVKHKDPRVKTIITEGLKQLPYNATLRQLETVYLSE